MHHVTYGMVWYGMVWYGMVWYGMVWYGMVWYGMVWYGMVLTFNVNVHKVTNCVESINIQIYYLTGRILGV